MDDDLAKKLFGELIPHLEAIETQNMAMLQFLKDKRIVTEKQFAAYLDRASDTCSVKWLATRIRMEHLISSAAVDDGKSKETVTHTAPAQKEQTESKQTPQETANDVGGEDAGARAASSGEQQAEASEHRQEPAAQEAANDAGQEDGAARAASSRQQQTGEAPPAEKTLEPTQKNAETATDRRASKAEKESGNRAA